LLFELVQGELRCVEPVLLTEDDVDGMAIEAEARVKIKAKEKEKEKEKEQEKEKEKAKENEKGKAKEKEEVEKGGVTRWLDSLTPHCRVCS